MIFGTVGNEHRDFDHISKLLEMINNIYPEEEIIYQYGFTKLKKVLKRKVI